MLGTVHGMTAGEGMCMLGAVPGMSAGDEGECGSQMKSTRMKSRRYAEGELPRGWRAVIRGRAATWMARCNQRESCHVDGAL